MAPENRRRRKERNTQRTDTSTWSEKDRLLYERNLKLQTPVAEMDLPVRVVNALEDNDVILAKDLMHQTYDSLMSMKNFGEKTLIEVKAALKTLGLEPPNWVEASKSDGKNVNIIKFW